ncbi:MAG: hypothetical protein JO252_23740 [Planctomycetaceae bacterium]|nr:hypothetical protein [Planctomycetaceae bacterium]
MRMRGQGKGTTISIARRFGLFAVSRAFAQAAAGAGIPAWDGEESPTRGKGRTQSAENPATQRINGRGALVNGRV